MAGATASVIASPCGGCVLIKPDLAGKSLRRNIIRDTRCIKRGKSTVASGNRNGKNAGAIRAKDIPPKSAPEKMRIVENSARPSGESPIMPPQVQHADELVPGARDDDPMSVFLDADIKRIGEGYIASLQALWRGSRLPAAQLRGKGPEEESKPPGKESSTAPQTSVPPTSFVYDIMVNAWKDWTKGDKPEASAGKGFGTGANSSPTAASQASPASSPPFWNRIISATDIIPSPVSDETLRAQAALVARHCHHVSHQVLQEALFYASLAAIAYTFKDHTAAEVLSRHGLRLVATSFDLTHEDPICQADVVHEGAVLVCKLPPAKPPPPAWGWGSAASGIVATVPYFRNVVARSLGAATPPFQGLLPIRWGWGWGWGSGGSNALSASATTAQPDTQEGVPSAADMQASPSSPQEVAPAPPTPKDDGDGAPRPGSLLDFMNVGALAAVGLEVLTAGKLLPTVAGAPAPGVAPPDPADPSTAASKAPAAPLVAPNVAAPAEAAAITTLAAGGASLLEGAVQGGQGDVTVTATAAAAGSTTVIVKEEVSSGGCPCQWYVCDDPATATRYFVIQGSDSLQSWQTNITFDPVDFEDPALGVRVHHGMYDAAKALYYELAPLAERHLATNPGGKVAFTGHSLGGSLGVLLALLLLMRGVISREQLKPVYTIGSPAVLCGGAELMEGLGLDESYVVAIGMHRDIVPRAFACEYPDKIASILRRLQPSSFNPHPCLDRGCSSNAHEHRHLYSHVGQFMVLQPQASQSPPHPLLPPGEGLYHMRPKRWSARQLGRSWRRLTFSLFPQLMAPTSPTDSSAWACECRAVPLAAATPAAETSASLQKKGFMAGASPASATAAATAGPPRASPTLVAAVTAAMLSSGLAGGGARAASARSDYRDFVAARDAVLNIPHPLEQLADAASYGPEGNISRDHDPRSYLAALEHILYSRRRGQEHQQLESGKCAAEGAGAGGDAVGGAPSEPARGGGGKPRWAKADGIWARQASAAAARQHAHGSRQRARNTPHV